MMKTYDWNQTHMVFLDGDVITFINAAAAIEWVCRGYSRQTMNKKFSQLLKEGAASSGGQWCVMSEAKYSELVHED